MIYASTVERIYFLTESKIITTSRMLAYVGLCDNQKQIRWQLSCYFSMDESTFEMSFVLYLIILKVIQTFSAFFNHDQK